jgi:copper homeostasis protein
VKKKILLEISVESVEGAAAAERGGADRIELCSNLSVGGLAPDLALLRAVREEIQIPIFVMIRPRAGDFIYSAAEFTLMKKSIAAGKDAGADGLVFGILKANRTVNIDRTAELVGLAQPLPVTCHRAFDACLDFSQALEDVVRSGASRILTSGGASTAHEGAATIKALVAVAGGARDHCSRSRNQRGKHFGARRGYTSSGVSFRLEQRVLSAANRLRKV